MYGLVNKAVEELIVRDFGRDKWKQVKDAAAVDVSAFISNDPYDDDITYRLVGAAAEVLELEAADLLIAFGRYWILNIANKSYGFLMAWGGETLPEFLTHLPQFHTRVALIFPDLQPPRFECSNVKDSSLHLHYRTHRPGLGKFVEGLLLGLGEHFSSPVRTTLLQCREQGSDQDVFLVEWSLPV